MEVIFNLCAHVICMHRGTILAEGTPDDIRGNRKSRKSIWVRKYDEEKRMWGNDFPTPPQNFAVVVAGDAAK
jgi:ABC-type multidrug transport system ATPase subunit